MLEGHLLNERYQIKATIGGGGMANVYLAKDIILEREVAIKVLRLEYANDEEFIARFDREAQSATSLSHPNIVNIYDVGEEDHILYMVMEYVEGMTLKEYIQRNGPIEVQEALDIMKQVTIAIAHAHANDIVHRDIKPQNILIDTYGQVKVTDFGIAIPKSVTFTCPYVSIKIFCGLISLCTMSLACACAIAMVTCFIISNASWTSIGPLRCMYSFSVIPSTYSMTIYKI